MIMINEDKNDDGIPDYNIDSDSDGKADLNIDTDNDGKADLNLVILKEWKTSKCVEINGVNRWLNVFLVAGPTFQPSEIAKVAVVDKGALDCTLKARVECAVLRGCGQSAENIPWGGAVR